MHSHHVRGPSPFAALALLSWGCSGLVPAQPSDAPQAGVGTGVPDDATPKSIGDLCTMQAACALPTAEAGDVDGNGQIENRDLAVLRHFLNGTSHADVCGASADIDGDGELTVSDARSLGRFLRAPNAPAPVGTTCSPSGGTDSFVHVEDGHFVVDGSPFYFAGTNAYYAIYADYFSPGFLADRLDLFADNGIGVVRVFAFSDGQDCDDPDGGPVIQTSPGVYDESALVELDKVVAAAKERNIRVVLTLTNEIIWGGGACQYLTWAGKDFAVDGDVPDGNGSYAFYTDPEIKGWYQDYAEMLATRVNTVTGVAYKDEPAVMAWELINEGQNPNDSDPGDCSYLPHNASSSATAGNVIRDWYAEMATFVHSVDPNHMVTTGEIGFEEGTPAPYEASAYGNTYWLRACAGSSYQKNTAAAGIDFTSIHMYPEFYGLSDVEGLSFLDDHASVAAANGKPLWLGEYGWTGSDGWGSDSADKVATYSMWWDAIANDDAIGGEALWQFVSAEPDHPWWLTKCTEDGANICASRDPELTLGLADHAATMSAK